jgi:hypothetical protein
MRNYQHLSEKGDEKDDFASLGTVNVIIGESGRKLLKIPGNRGSS